MGGLLLLFKDITGEQDLQTRFNALIKTQTSTLDSLHEAVVVFGSDGRLKLSNKAFTSLWSLDPQLIIRVPFICPVKIRAFTLMGIGTALILGLVLLLHLGELVCVAHGQRRPSVSVWRRPPEERTRSTEVQTKPEKSLSLTST